MNNVVMRKVTTTGAYQALSSVKLVASVTISALPTNLTVVNFLGDTGQDVPWQPGEWHEFHSVNLAEIKIKGNGADAVTVIGGTW